MWAAAYPTNTIPTTIRDIDGLLCETLTSFRRTMTLRCAVHEYRMVTQGRAEFALHGKLNVWDHAAGALAVTVAGGVARLLDGQDSRPEMREGHLLVAASEPLWDALAGMWRLSGSGQS